MHFDWLLERYPAEGAQAEPPATQRLNGLSFEVHPLGKGLDVKLVRGRTVGEPLTVRVATTTSQTLPSLVVPIAPALGVDVPGIQGVRRIARGEHFWQCPDEPWSDYHVGPGEKILTAGFGLTPEFIAETVPNQGRCAPLGALSERNRRAPFFIGRRTSAALRNAVFELLHNPYHGRVGQLFTEAKAMEAIAIALDTLAPPIRPQNRRLSPWEVRRIEDARERLTADLRNPPTSRELAHAVGLPLMRFERGFREVFGASVFRWLQNYKLELAHELLQTQPLPIKEIAFRLGYTHTSNFVHAFRRRFGEPPGAVRRR